MSEIAFAVRWYLAIQLFGLAALPISLRLFRRLPDRGYGLSKPLGLLLAGWLYWILGTMGLLPTTQGGALFVIGSVLAFGGLVAIRQGAGRRRGGRPIAAKTAARWRAVVVTEIVFAAAFIAWTLVRSRMPRIEPAGGEKWMEIAFLRAIMRSDAFPPHDPWLAGYAISYYYFGYVIIGMVAKLSAVPASIAFNLGIAVLFALTCATAYSLVYSLIVLGAEKRDATTQVRATAGGLLGPLLLAVMANLEGLLEVLHARGIGTAGFWRWLDIRSLTDAPPAYAQGSWIPTRFFWWWQASRVIRDTAPWGDHWEVIDEFPAFSFILGDMHPHVLALPFVLLAVGLALDLYARTVDSPWGRDDPYRLFASWPIAGWEAVLFALCLGGLGFLNTWDFPIYLGLACAAYGIARWRAVESPSLRSVLVGAAALFIGLLGGGVLLYLPFWLGLQTQASGVLPNLFNPTRLPQFLVMFGPLLAICAAFVTARARRARVKAHRVALALLLAITAVVLVALLATGVASILNRRGLLQAGGATTYLASWLDGGPVLLPGTGEDVTEVVAGRLTARPLASWTALLLLAGAVTLALVLARRAGPVALRGDRPSQSLGPPGEDFSLLMIGVGALLALSVEFVYLRDVFGTRMNTVFKFYFQTWVLWSIAGAYGLASFTLGGHRRVAALPRQHRFRRAWRATGRAVGLAALWLCVVGGTVYTPLAIATRGAEYGGRHTLDGAAHLAVRDAGDYDAIVWLNANVTGAPVVLEAPGGSYTYSARISAHTGLPTVLGWPGHERQWRGGGEQQQGREEDIDSIYAAQRADEVSALLDRYGVRYVVIGALEKSLYAADGLSRLEALLIPVFESGGTAVYSR